MYLKRRIKVDNPEELANIDPHAQDWRLFNIFEVNIYTQVIIDMKVGDLNQDMQDDIILLVQQNNK